MNIRDKALEIAFEQFGKPYKFGANGPDEFDCSAFLIYIWQRTGVYPFGVDDTAQGLFNHFKGNIVRVPYKGCAAFYGTLDKITHCTLVVNKGVIIGANGRPQERAVTVELANYRNTRYGLNDLVAIVDPYLENYN